MENVLVVSDVVKHYAGKQAVRGVSFQLAPGDFVGLIGPNGAGKSTTLRMITGMLLPTRGTITLQGADITRDPLLPRRAIGYVPEYISLYDYLTGWEYLDFVGEVKGLPAQVRRAQAEALLEMLDLADERAQLVRTYSQGMRRKVALAGAMLGDPPLLVLDEALNGLDPTTVARLKVHLTEKARGGTAILLASHVLDVVERVCTGLVVLVGGEVVDRVDGAQFSGIRQGEGGLEAWFLQRLRRGEG